MSLFGLVKDKDVDETPVAQKPAPAPRAVPFQSIVPNSNISVAPFAAAAPAMAPTNNGLFAAAIAPDPEYVADLQGKAANTKNRAYETFTKALAVLAAIPNEQQRYLTALQMIAATANTDVATVLSALDESLANIDADNIAFDNATGAQFNTDVTKKQEMIQNLAAKLDAMQKEMQQISADIQTLSSAATTAQTQIEHECAVYAASRDAVKTAITTERQKIASVAPTK